MPFDFDPYDSTVMDDPHIDFCRRTTRCITATH